MVRGHMSGMLRQILLALALIAAGSQAALPQGYMLERSGENGLVSVVFCSAGLGGQARWLNLSTGEIEERETSSANTSCTASAAQGDLVQPWLTAGIPVPSRITHQRLRPTPDLNTSRLHYRPPARAPPVRL